MKTKVFLEVNVDFDLDAIGYAEINTIFLGNHEIPLKWLSADEMLEVEDEASWEASHREQTARDRHANEKILVRKECDV